MSSSNPVSVFGIRHHGPGSAYGLANALLALQPDLILVEGPPDAQELIEWVANSDLIPPVALLLYAVDQPGMAAYYPFAEFSPEWQAIKFGLSNKIDVRFMDLHQSYQFAARQNMQQDLMAAEALLEEPPEMLDPLSWIAQVAGYEDSERWWEHLIEHHRHQGIALFTAIREMITTLRTEVEKESIERRTIYNPRPFEIQREAAMRQMIRESQVQGFQKIAVVCGAWHVPALTPEIYQDEDKKMLKGMQKTKVAATWVPWSFSRLSWMSGYGAGIESPGWYEVLWNAARANQSPADVTIRWLTLTANLLREEGLLASSAQVIDAVRLAEALAALRNQPIPGLRELNEATQAVFCFGDSLPLRLIQEKLVVNDRLGRVPTEAPVTPLQADLQQQQKSLRLPPEAFPRDFDLDLRKPNDLKRSHLLHRLTLLEIPWGETQVVSGKSGTFHELWRLQWKPEWTVKIIEAGLWGNSIRDAAEAFLSHKANQEGVDLLTLTSLVNNALLAELAGAVDVLMARLESEAALTNDTGLLMESLPYLINTLRYGSVRQTNTEMLTRVVDGVIARICLGMPLAFGSLDDAAAAEMFSRLVKVQNALWLLQNHEHQKTWLSTLKILANQSGVHGLLKGRACAILLEKGEFDANEISRRLNLALSSANESFEKAAWIEGLLMDSGAILIHEDTLWKVIDEWVDSLSKDAFMEILPLLRRTFSSFTGPVRRKLGERVQKGSVTLAGKVQTNSHFDPERAKIVLPILEQLLGLKFDM